MDDHMRHIFTAEIETQCRSIGIAATALDDALASNTTNAVWYHLQGVLVAAANISKILWGSKGKREAEREPLRTYLNVGDDSALRDPDLRNDFEHFDQRLEAWYADYGPVDYVGRNIGPPGMFVVQGETKRFHHFDPTTGLVSFWDHEVSIPAVLNEVGTLLGVISRHSDR